MADKYLAVFWWRVKTMAAYPLDLIGNFAKLPLQVFILALIWYSVFLATGAETIAGYSLPVFMVYIIGAHLLRSAAVPWAVYEDQEFLICKGNIASILVRPFRYFWYSFARSFSEYAVDGLVGSACCLALIFGVSYFSPAAQLPSFISVALFALAFLVGVLITYSIAYLLCMTMFWAGDIWSVWEALERIDDLLSGKTIPLTIHPTFAAVAAFFPFQYLISVPLRILLGELSAGPALILIGKGALWIVGLCVLAHIVYRAGLRKMDNQGG